MCEKWLWTLVVAACWKDYKYLRRTLEDGDNLMGQAVPVRLYKHMVYKPHNQCPLCSCLPSPF